MAQIQSATLDGLPKRFINAMRTLFDILDDQKTGCIRFSDIQQWWQDDGAKGLPKGVLDSLQKVTPPNGLLTFERFCAGLKICLMRNQVEAQKAQKADQPEIRKQAIRPPSAPTLENSEPGSKVAWVNTATVRPNNAIANRAISMPQLLHENDNPANYGSSRPHPPFIHNQGSGPPLYGPPKPPRSAPGLERPLTERNGQPDRTEIWTALHNWQKDMVLQVQDPNLPFPKGRSSGDGKPSGYSDAPPVQGPPQSKKPGVRRREPRRHTLQNGVDYNMMKRIKLIEQEKDMLLQGLAAVDRTKEWYLKQISVVQEKMKYLGNLGSHAEVWSEAHAEKLELQKARVLEVNRHLDALTESWERGGLPLHINLAVHHLASAHPSRITHQNRLLSKELREKSERITHLEQEKAGLMRELYQAQCRLQARQMKELKLNDRVGFM